MDSYIQILLGQIVRHALTVAAGLLTAYGITADQQTALVGTVTSVVVSLIMFAIANVWSFASKKKALETDPRSL